MPVKKPKYIVYGMSGKTKIFAGRATKDKRFILYSISGKTSICADIVEDTVSLCLNFSVIKVNLFLSIGET